MRSGEVVGYRSIPGNSSRVSDKVRARRKQGQDNETVEGGGSM